MDLGAPPYKHRPEKAQQKLAEVFRKAGWRFLPRPARREGLADLVVRRRGHTYVVELKAGSEGRSDRLIALWSQAFLQAARKAGRHAPLAVVAAPKVPARVARHVLDFAAQFAPGAAVGVFDLEGLCMFRGAGLENMDAVPPSGPLVKRGAAEEPANLFSDLNQWMLKVLLAPEIPPELISAPRESYRNASQLARAAGVSVMSAFRFVQQLQRQGHLHEAGAPLRLVRRASLFARWQASQLRNVREVPMRFLLRDARRKAGIQQLLGGGRACLALFAAADALGFGMVEGVPPHLYVRRLPPELRAWKNVVPVEPGEAPDIIVRQATAPQSVFRGVVHPKGLASCDILQVWLDVSGHPSRGQEQAKAIRREVLARIIDGDRRG
jgi:hypothetical protein